MRRRPFATILLGPSALRREGLSQILGAADFRIVACATTIQTAQVTLAEGHKSLLLIVDANDDPHAAAEQIKIFKADHPSGRVAVLSLHASSDDIISAFQAGANAYFVNVLTCNGFIKALELIMLGETILPPELLTAFDKGKDTQLFASTLDSVNAEAWRSDNAPRLSEREKYILRCIVEGASNKLIARKLNIAEATVKVHVKAILRKIRTRNRTQAAIWATHNSTALVATDDRTMSSPASSSAVPAVQIKNERTT